MAAGSLPTRKRRPHRRDEILGAAAALFQERGFESTGIDDIGAAIGMTGPAVYRHFESKQDILETLVVSRGEQTLAAMRAIVAEGDPDAPEVALRRLVDQYATAIATSPAAVVVATYERRTLGPATRRTLDRLEKENVSTWLELVGRLRPDLIPAEVRTLVTAALNMGVAVANYDSGLDWTEVRDLLSGMLLDALGVSRRGRVQPRRRARGGSARR